MNPRDFAKETNSEKEDKEVCNESGLGTISLGEAVVELPDSTPNDFEPQVSFFEYAASIWGFHYASSESDSVELMKAALKLSTGMTRDNWSRPVQNVLLQPGQFARIARRSNSGCLLRAHWHD